VIVDSALYLDGHRHSEAVSLVAMETAHLEDGAFGWIGLAEPTVNEVKEVFGSFRLHETAIEDAVSAQQRARIEENREITTFVIRTVFYDDNQSSISTGELICFIHKRFIIISRHGSGSQLVSVRSDLESRTSFHEELKPYFRDISDQLARASEQGAAMDSLLTAALQADLAQVQVRQNSDVRRISAWVALAALPTMVAGIYGMNFKYMPELELRVGYPAVMALTFPVAHTSSTNSRNQGGYRSHYSLMRVMRSCLTRIFLAFFTFSSATTATQINKTIETGATKNQINPSRKPSGSPGIEPSSLSASLVPLLTNMRKVYAEAPTTPNGAR
jgi:Mg2+ and Co2+ transporter CorA